MFSASQEILWMKFYLVFMVYSLLLYLPRLHLLRLVIYCNSQNSFYPFTQISARHVAECIRVCYDLSAVKTEIQYLPLLPWISFL